VAPSLREGSCAELDGSAGRAGGFGSLRQTRKERLLGLPAAVRLPTILLAMALMLPGCTDDGTEGSNSPSDNAVSAATFMDDVCTSMSDWLADFLAGYQDVRGLDPDSSAQQVKKALDEFLAEAIASTRELQTAVREAGTPEVEGGEGFAARLIDALDQAAAALEDARDQLAGLPNDPTRFRAAAIALGDTVREQLAAAGDAIRQDVPALRKAAQDTPACQSLGGSFEGPPS
jgi:hypothetical protein